MKAVDPVLLILFLGIFMALAALVTVDWFFKGEGQVFQLAATLLTSFSTAFFVRILPDKPKQPAPTDTNANKLG